MSVSDEPDADGIVGRMSPTNSPTEDLETWEGLMWAMGVGPKNTKCEATDSVDRTI